MIRNAVKEDLDWMIDKSIGGYNKIYKKKISESKLRERLEKTLDYIYVFEDRSAYISTYIFKEKPMQYINAWFSEKAGNGMKLWKFITIIAKELGLTQFGYMHKNEHKFNNFLVRNGYTIEHFNRDLNFVYKEMGGA